MNIQESLRLPRRLEPAHTTFSYTSWLVRKLCPVIGILGCIVNCLWHKSSLRAPGSKTQIYEPNEPADFLGVDLKKKGSGYSVRILKPQLTEIRSRLLNLSDMQFLSDEGITLSALSRRLDGAIAGYTSAYDFCDNANHLKQKLDDWKREVLTRIFRDGIGVDLGALSPDKLAFLELNP